MRKAIFFFTLIVSGLAAMAWSRSATDEHRAITAVAQNYMDAYYTADPALMQRSLHPDFHKRTLRTINGQTQITEDTVQSMLEGVGVGKWEGHTAQRARQKHTGAGCLSRCRQRKGRDRPLDRLHAPFKT